MTPTEFLLARIAEDVEALEDARIGDGPEWWMPPQWSREQGLAECEAKRQVVEIHRQTVFTDVQHGIRDEPVCAVCHYVRDFTEDDDEPDFVFMQAHFPCPTLRALALPYADRHHYQEVFE